MFYKSHQIPNYPRWSKSTCPAPSVGSFAASSSWPWDPPATPCPPLRTATRGAAAARCAGPWGLSAACWGVPPPLPRKNHDGDAGNPTKMVMLGAGGPSSPWHRIVLGVVYDCWIYHISPPNGNFIGKIHDRPVDLGGVPSDSTNLRRN